MTNIVPWPSIERALLQVILTYDGMPEDANEALERVGGDLAYDGVMPWYVRIDEVPGGASNQIEGIFVVDVEVFAPEYTIAESVSNDLEALLLRYPHVVEVDDRKVVFDRVTQNSRPNDFPWEDETVTRLGATYVITARRR